MNRHDFWLRLRALFLPRRGEAELDEELQFHLEMEARKNRALGVAENDAKRQASLRFGNLTAIAEQCRDERGIRLIDNLGRDLRYGCRQLRRTPIFTLMSILSLALGVGANTALFAVFDAAYLRKVAVPQPDDLVSFQWKAFGESNPLAPRRIYGSRISTSDEKSGKPYSASTSFGMQPFEALRKAADVPAEVFGFASFQASVDIDGWPHDVSAQVVSGNYFQALRTGTVAGRPLEPSDDTPVAAPAAVISEFAWRDLFASDPSTIGRNVVLNGVSITIVGVIPAEFQLEGGILPAFSVPMTHASRISQGTFGRTEVWWLQVMARKAPGTTITQVENSLQGLFEGSVLALRPSSEQIRPEQIPRLVAFSGSRGFVRIGGGRMADFLLTVATVFGFLLLIVCLNLANLLIARGSSREYEVGMRLALGASRFRLVRQLLTESLLLSSLGGVAGALMAFWGKELLKPYLDQQIALTMSWRILAFNILIATAAGLLFGLAPALRATQSIPIEATRRKSGSGAQPRALVSKSLVVIQVAMSVVLLVGAALLVQSNDNWKRLDLGFKPETLVTFDTPRPSASRLGAGTLAVITERIRGVPGVLGVSTAICFPPSSCGQGIRSRGDDTTRLAGARQLDIAPTFLATLGSSLIAGRNFRAGDETVVPDVAIIDENAARRLFPGENPLGKQFDFGADSDQVFEVIGVAKSVVFDVGRPEIRPVFYTLETSAKQVDGTGFVVRIAGDTESVIRGIRSAVAEVDPSFPLFNVTTVRQIIERHLSQQRQLSLTWTFFGASALLLTAIGLYGLMAYIISRRVSEIGLRIALGASSLSILRLVMRQISRLVLIGLVIGFVASLALNQVIRAYVFGVDLFELPTFIGVALVVAAITTLACYLPARKATRVDPVTALRCD